MGETNSPSVAHVSYDIFPLSRVKFKMLTWVEKYRNLYIFKTMHYELTQLHWRYYVYHARLECCQIKSNTGLGVRVMVFNALSTIL
jgi:hypothetical protein